MRAHIAGDFFQAPGLVRWAEKQVRFMAIVEKAAGKIRSNESACTGDEYSFHLFRKNFVHVTHDAAAVDAVLAPALFLFAAGAVRRRPHSQSAQLAVKTARGDDTGHESAEASRKCLCLHRDDVTELR